MTPREGFRFGFLYRCAEEGLDAAAALQRAELGMQKRAIWEELKAIPGAALGVAKNLGGLAVLGGVAIPVAAGVGAGLTAAKARERDIDPEEVRRQELIEAYRFHAEQARRRAAMKGIRAGGPLT
jgi:hypothetical protein